MDKKQVYNSIEPDCFPDFILCYSIYMDILGVIYIKEVICHYRHKIPYRNDELKKIFEMEEKQIVERVVPVSFDFINGKAIGLAR